MKKQRIPLIIHKLEENSFHILIKDESLENENNLFWIVDTGASKTVIDKKLEEKFEVIKDKKTGTAKGISSESMNISQGILPELKLDSKIFSQVNVTLIELEHVNNHYKETGPYIICGLIGCDFLLSNQIMINFEEQIISF